MPRLQNNKKRNKSFNNRIINFLIIANNIIIHMELKKKLQYFCFFKATKKIMKYILKVDRFRIISSVKVLSRYYILFKLKIRNGQEGFN